MLARGHLSKTFFFAYFVFRGPSGIYQNDWTSRIVQKFINQCTLLHICIIYIILNVCIHACIQVSNLRIKPEHAGIFLLLRRVNTTSCDPDEWLAAASPRWHPHKKINRWQRSIFNMATCIVTIWSQSQWRWGAPVPSFILNQKIFYMSSQHIGQSCLLPEK